MRWGLALLLLLLPELAWGQQSLSLPTPYLDQGVLVWTDGGGGSVTYNVKCGPSSGGPYTRTVMGLTQTSALLTQLFGGPHLSQWFCVVTGVNASGGESDPSNEITFILYTKAYHYIVF